MKSTRGVVYPKEACYCRDVCTPQRHCNVAELVDRPYQMVSRCSRMSSSTSKLLSPSELIHSDSV